MSATLPQPRCTEHFGSALFEFLRELREVAFPHRELEQPVGEVGALALGQLEHDLVLNDETRWRDAAVLAEHDGCVQCPSHERAVPVVSQRLIDAEDLAGVPIQEVKKEIAAQWVLGEPADHRCQDRRGPALDPDTEAG